MGVVSRVQIQLTTEATHQLESQGQALSAGSKSSSSQKPLTSWRAKDRHRQQSPNTVWHHSHLLSGKELRAGFKRIKQEQHSPPGYESTTHTVRSVCLQSIILARTNYGWGKEQH